MSKKVKTIIRRIIAILIFGLGVYVTVWRLYLSHDPKIDGYMTLTIMLWLVAIVIWCYSLQEIEDYLNRKLQKFHEEYFENTEDFDE